MKYLRLVDHLGQEVLRLNVYLEGVDFEWESPVPQAVWLGKIQIVDEIPEAEYEPRYVVTEVEPVRIEELLEAEVKPEPVPTEPEIGRIAWRWEKEREIMEREEAEEAEAVKELEEETHDVEKVWNEGAGDKGTGAPEHPESTEELPQVDTGRRPAKRGKRTRQRKAS